MEEEKAKETAGSGVKITLTETVSGDIRRFPMLPEEISVECGTRFQSYDIMNVGEIMLPLGEELTRFSWSCTLPGPGHYEKIPDQNGEAKPDYTKPKDPYIQLYTDRPWYGPENFQQWLSRLRFEGVKCHLKVDGTPIDHDVYLESYSVNYRGAYGDYECDVSFVHAKELTVKTEGSAEKKEDGKADSSEEEKRPEKPQETTYQVVQGDCLWNIAQAKLGDGSRYPEIAELNHIANADLIYPGQTLLLPEE